ncbi:DUF4349 domain-containing protein [Neobacillus sp. Marseille-QA0830]
MKKNAIKWLFVLIALICLAGCSSSSKDQSAGGEEKNSASMDSAKAGGASEAQSSITSGQPAEKTVEQENNLEVPNQMVIYQADLQLRVKNFDQTIKAMEEKAQGYGGYIAESTLNRQGDDQLSGTIKIRVPEQHFQDFLHDAEDTAAEVLQRNITGQDVTEEYVDLQSRLKSKRVVEDRLTSFLQGAAKTEDLLKISEDLAAVQEEIETIEGKIKFLENQTAYSTIMITLYEDKVVVPDIDGDKLNTWEKTKQQFMNSTNWLLAGLSGLVIFIFGNLPVLLLIAVIMLAGVYIYRRRKHRNKSE